MTRKPDWQGELDRFFAAHAKDRFVYGSWDCCLFVCDAIHTMTGTDPGAWFRERYASREEAKTLIREYTGALPSSVAKVAEYVTAEYGMPEVLVAQAQRGDVALIRRTLRECSLGIVALNGTEVMVVTPHGLKGIPLAKAGKVWRV